MNVVVVNKITKRGLQVQLGYVPLYIVSVNRHKHIRHDSTTTVNGSFQNKRVIDLSLVYFI